MFRLIRRYTKWLHTRWPAGKVERLPQVNDDGSTNVKGVYITGDLTGVPLLKFSVDTGARAVKTILGESGFKPGHQREHSGRKVHDLVIIGGGVSGFSAALEARKHDLDFAIIEASEPFSTIASFPKGKPIFTYPTDMTPEGEIEFTGKSDVKEGLLEELREQTIDKGIEPIPARAERIRRTGGLLEVVMHDHDNLLAQRVIVAIGRSGNYRKLNVPGEELDKVYHRLYDPKDYCDQDVLVVGGGDSALETAIALGSCGARVTLSYRKPEFSRPKPGNIEKLEALSQDADADVSVDEPSSERVTTASGSWMGEPASKGSVKLLMSSEVKAIREDEVEIELESGQTQELSNDAVFAMIGREPPLDFFRRSGIRITGEWRPMTYVSFIGFLLFCVLLYHWAKNPSEWQLASQLRAAGAWFPFGLYDTLRNWADTKGHLLHTLAISVSSPSFYYTLAYCSAVVIFGIKRIRRRKTPYVKVQTLTLTAIQVLPLFLLPEILLPWMGHNGLFDSGWLKSVADQFFPASGGGHGREYWRAYGLILAWPLLVVNFFTSEPLWGWLVLGSLQTFVLIPLIIYYWGKGAYCGWICSCGALAETMGDAHRQKMPHGPVWNRVNMVGQVFLGLAVLLLLVQIAAWVTAGPVTTSIASVRYDAEQEVTRVGLKGERLDVDAVRAVAVGESIQPGAEAGSASQPTGGASSQPAGGSASQPAQRKASGGSDDLVRLPVREARGGELVLAGDQTSRLEAEAGIQLRYASTDLHETLQGIFDYGYKDIPFLNYSWFVDLLWAGIIGVGFYFWFSGRVWCRFACPLAALMHIYARFTRFRILAEKDKCISCNVCTSVCHQGIDVMNFANKGQPMEDPQCVRCSACVQSCPTGVLWFGQVDRRTGEEVARDRLGASPVIMTELTVNGDRQKDNHMMGKTHLRWLGGVVTAFSALLIGGLIYGCQQGDRQAGDTQTAGTGGQQGSRLPEVTVDPFATFDHSAFDEILKKTVEGELIDYLAIRDNHMASLEAYLDRMAQTEPRKLPSVDRLTFYINLYNATMIKAVIDRYHPGYTPAEDDYSVFKDKLVRLPGRSISLDHLEKQIMLVEFKEPRIHVAVVCAAKSCPPILPRAYRADDLDQVLEANMKRFINESSRNRIDHASDTLYLSAIFDWYADDFGGRDNLADYVNRYHEGQDVSDYRVQFLDYDWSLNIAK